jgi:Family of unknown function (DUF6917)
LQATNDPYKLGKITTNAYAKRTPLLGRVVAVLDLKLDNRGLKLIEVPTRVLLGGSIHEFLCTDTVKAPYQDVVDKVGAVAFVEFLQGGVVRKDDGIFFSGKQIGTIAGFDETHFPNHLNVLIRTPSIVTGTELGLELGDSVIIKTREQ